jgi:predicted 2-oxoglutarate/Fe(II)-dependent dioxygenase YbiX
MKEYMTLSENEYDALAKFIVIVDDVVPKKLCDRIIKEYKTCKDWEHAAVGEGTLAKNIRNTDTIAISKPLIIDNNSKIRSAIDKEVFQSASKAITTYNSLFPHVRIEEDSGYDLLRYDTGQFYTEHVDSFKRHPRSVSCSFAINDEYEGGEFAFFGRKFKYNLKKGSAIMFPSNFMYPHEIMPVTKGTRYSIITWFI